MTRDEAMKRYFANLGKGRSGDHAYALQQFGNDCEQIGREGRIAEGAVAMGDLVASILETPDDPARTAPPGELWSDQPVEEDGPDADDETCWDESGHTAGAGAGAAR